MQAIIAIPDLKTLDQLGGAEQALFRKVCGVPLLLRTIKTAVRAGVDSVVVMWPADVPLSLWLECKRALTGESLRRLTITWPGTFNPRETLQWSAISPALLSHFLWIPWNWVTHESALANLSPTAAAPFSWYLPVMLAKNTVLCATCGHIAADLRPEGIRVVSDETSQEAEWFLVKKSVTPLKGVYPALGGWLCRPMMWLLSRAGITPNAMTAAGLASAILGAWWFAQGSYLAYVTGAALFLMSGLFDEMCGMLARIKFHETAIATRFAGFAAKVTNLLVLGGITAGLYRQYGPRELFYGTAALAGCVLSVLVIHFQRKCSADPPRHKGAGEMSCPIDSEPANPISRFVRHIHAFLKKAETAQYLLLFAMVGELPIFLRLAAFGAHLTWILTIYYSFRFFRAPIALEEKAI